MKNIECENCGSKDLYEDSGYLICRHCGSRFLPTKDERPSQVTIDLRSDVQSLLEKWDGDPANGSKYARLILEIDPSNVRAKRYLYGYTTETSGQTSGQTSGGCYIATAVYGSYDCPQVWTLRRYRDDTLAKTVGGRLFIKSYYLISPIVVKYFGKTEWFKNFCKPKLDRFVRKLNSEGVSDKSYQDKY